MRPSITKRTIFEIFISLLLIASVFVNYLQKSTLKEKERTIISQTYMSDSLYSISQKLQSKVVDQHETILDMSLILDIQTDVIRTKNQDIKFLLKELNAVPIL